MKHALLTISLSLTALLVTACAGTSPTAPSSATPTAMMQSVPSSTASATATDTATVMPTQTDTPRPSATAGPDFGEASILSVAHLEDRRLMVTILVPDGVEGVYDAYIGTSYLPCETPSQYPKRILCIGPQPYVNYSPQGALIELYPLYPTPEAPPLFEAFITVPAQATPTATQPVWYPPLPDIPGFP